MSEEFVIPCIQRGGKIKYDRCDLCGERGQTVPVYECSVHNVCTMTRQHSGYRSCAACEDRQETESDLPVRFQEPPPKPVPSHQFLRDGKGDRVTGFFNRYRGGSAFLICGGPSLDETPLHLLRNPGILTATVNNVATIFRSDLWFGVDIPGHFHEAIWRDQGIEKFMMWKHNSERLRRWNQKTQQHEQIETQARETPNTWFYDHDKGFDPNQFLIQAKPTWGWAGGPEGKQKALACDVMLPALRILHWMGIRTLYLVGCDFRMSAERPYAFDEGASSGRARWNNEKYRVLNSMFKQMQGHFAEYGYKVWNCTPGGNLTAFPRITLGEAVERALNQSQFPREVRTRGLYTE